jgi:crossover junction endodeoxyribonuclease RuvC
MSRVGLVLGIDPGTRRLGWGLVRKEGTRLVHVAHGVIQPGDALPLGDRLVVLEKELARVVSTHRPERASLEAMFFAKDAQAAAKLGHARGVALLVCARAGVAICEYAPARVKRTVTASGRADKAQVAGMVRALLALVEVPATDAADALALAITSLQESSLHANARISEDLKPRAGPVHRHRRTLV